MEQETKIRGLRVIYNLHNIKIIDSYQINNEAKMKEIITEALEKNTLYRTNRTMNDFIKEWKAHNRLYKLHLFRNHTKDVDFEDKVTEKKKCIYSILGR